MGFAALSLKGRALRLLSQREHSRDELRRKLARHVQEGEDLDAVLDDLQAKDFISEARVVESTVHRRASRLGAARIRQELQAKGVAPDLVQQAVAGLHDSEFARAHALWTRRFDALPGDAKERGRQGRFLLTRGFSGEVIHRVLRGEVPHDGASEA
ncbi:recombination regulator RecX [Acidovorax sp. BL-A-41-H1]|uniref:recombination regulator RecX n=1 Tax=Acidovorax sp. BL-A-41-H1 TaxID=3421102 RepID=UPI003F7B31ED